MDAGMAVLTKRMAAEEMIDEAISAIERGKLAAALSLAAAAEGAMPPPVNEEAFFLQTKRYFMDGMGLTEKEAVELLNGERNWLKHFNYNQTASARLDLSAPALILRAIRKFEQNYGIPSLTPAMLAWIRKKADEVCQIAPT